MKKKKNSEINWEEKIVRDLGSDKYNELFTSTNEEINISPFYVNTKNSLINSENLLFPDEWKIVSEIDCLETSDLENELKNLFNNEITNIILKNFSKIDLLEFDLDKLNVFLKTNNLKEIEEYHNKGLHIIFEPDLEDLNILKTNDFLSKSYSINISSEFFKNSGANIIQEIAFTLSAANEYLNKFGKEVAEKISFEVIQGSNYFFEIAKIQALRILWSLITKDYGNQIDNCVITAKPSLKNKTINNYNNNIIRSTSECLSGILGGCNFIKSIAYDVRFKDKNAFSQRIMNNQLLILKNETLIDKVNNSISGSYYLTYLIEELAQKSLNLFKRIEKKGGYFKSLNKNELFNEILLNQKTIIN